MTTPGPQSLVDIGANLTHESFKSDLDQVLAEAEAAGVRRLIVTGTTVADSVEAADLAAQHPGRLFSTAGVHPHYAKGCDDHTLGHLRTLAARPEVVALGEAGLDYNRDFSPRPVQRHWCAAQLQLATELKMPVFLHSRDAHADMLALVSEHRDGLVDGVVHCFTGTAEEARDWLDLGLHIGITGWICDERRGTHLREVVKTIPLDRLMVETDCPYLMPRTLRPRPKTRRNVPAHLPHVTEILAECMGLPIDEVAQGTTATAERFFRLV
ncbi:MAG: TatD family hydrolase [Bradymonadia bacterium]